MTKKLIINSDDYGRSPEISRGIRDSHLKGVVTSTTCMMNISTTAADIAVALEETPNLGLGVHLVLTMGQPVLPHDKVKSVTDANGNFFKYTPFIEHLDTLDIEEVKAEWRAQIDAFVKAAGKNPTHLDSHHHSSFFSPKLFRGMLELAREYGCPIRLPVVHGGGSEMAGLPPQVIGPIKEYAPGLLDEFNPKRPTAFFASFYDELVTREELESILDQVDEGVFEIMCHPGYVDEAFAKESVYNFQRVRELEILTDPAVKESIAKRGIQLISFADL